MPGVVKCCRAERQDFDAVAQEAIASEDRSQVPFTSATLEPRARRAHNAVVNLGDSIFQICADRVHGEKARRLSSACKLSWN
jgi:hypothetical protein